MTRRMSRPVAAALAALAAGAMLAGCSALVAGTPMAAHGVTPSPSPSPSPSSTDPTGGSTSDTTNSLLGDITTIDPCSLIADGDLASVGGTPGPKRVEALDYCVLPVDQGGGVKVEMYYGQLSLVSKLPATKKPGKAYGSLQTFNLSEDTSLCERQLVLPGELAMQVQAQAIEGTPTAAKLCELADAATGLVARTVSAPDQVKHFSFPSNSLGSLNACTFMTRDVMLGLPNMSVGAPTDYPAHHMCRWGVPGATQPHAYLMFNAGKVTPTGTEHAEEDIAGRHSLISKSTSGNRAVCDIQAAHIPFGDSSAGLTEIAEISATLPGKTIDDACGTARAIAAVIWPKLPHA
ncbi:DUF3558 domain-containing protein [Solihabitans fulvus]|uniref:DUF3558 domain-containing protein n=1 Tax=Solihabitans fulvus TaxID=1892852 RepID=A0A5B2XWJ0_9PSEU|nr:DUF3558 family protein [Solihabitans fulvus]KAA2267061.1 DUF3558 domain-containing protein [Solihabitans fulvus]